MPRELIQRNGRDPKNPTCPNGHDWFIDNNIAWNARGDYYCRRCIRERSIIWRSKRDPEVQRRQARESAARCVKKLRNEAIQAYGGKCVCCGESIPEFLHLDHVNNDGAEHRRELKGDSKGSNSLAVLRWAKENGWPPRLQLKCHNCGMAEGFYGRCPHEQ